MDENIPMQNSDPEPLPSGSASGRFQVSGDELREVFKRPVDYNKGVVFENLYGPFKEKTEGQRPRIKITVWGENREELEEKAILEGKEFFPNAKLQVLWNTEAMFNHHREEWSAELIVVALVPATIYTPSFDKFD